MSLDALSNEISMQAEAEAKQIIDNAKAEAKKIKDQAKSQAASAAADVEARASKDSKQISIEVVAAARQANQKRALVARREELDMTWESVKDRVSSPDLEGRNEIIQSLVKEASSSGSDMVMRPVKIDRKALSSSEFTLGDDIEGLGGFVLESKDGSVVLDYRFDSLLEDAWKANLWPVNKAIFGGCEVKVWLV